MTSDTFGLDESDETIEEGGIYKGKLKFSGSITIWTYESNEDFEYKFHILPLSVKSGKAKIVLISPDNYMLILSLLRIQTNQV